MIAKRHSFNLRMNDSLNDPCNFRQSHTSSALWEGWTRPGIDCKFTNVASGMWSTGTESSVTGTATGTVEARRGTWDWVPSKVSLFIRKNAGYTNKMNEQNKIFNIDHCNSKAGRIIKLKKAELVVEVKKGSVSF